MTVYQRNADLSPELRCDVCDVLAPHRATPFFGGLLLVQLVQPPPGWVTAHGAEGADRHYCELHRAKCA